MRISYITENTIDVASDVNDSLLEVDGLIPLEVETLENTPTLQDAVLGKYYAESGKVLTLNETENAFLISYPVLIIYNSLLYMLKNGQWEVAGGTILVLQETGQSTTSTMSQKAISDELELKADKSQIKQTTGLSETDIMSQKAITNSMSDIFSSGDLTGITLKSPNGTKYELTVDDNGGIQTTQI